MRRVLALLLLTPFLANCSDTPTPAAPSGAAFSTADAPAEETWPVEENWYNPGGVYEIVEEGSIQAVGAPGSPTAREMVFGNPTVGSGYAPGVHDESFHALDRINPGAVVIPVNGTVTFKVNPGHRVGIYLEGTKPEDIQPNPGYFLLYPVNRIFLQPAPVPQFTLRFLVPGKYLVICAVNSHFFAANMWGWVTVK